MKVFNRCIIIISTVILAGLIAILNQVTAAKLPQLGDPVARTLSLSQEKQLGLNFYQVIQKKMPICHDAIINTYIQDISTQLINASDSSRHSFHIFIVDDNSINAFAGPGGYIGINSGLILQTQSESQLAAAIAHEIVHVVKRHIAHNIAQMKSLHIPNMLALATAIALGANGQGAAAAGILSSSTALSFDNMLQFSKQQEQQADSYGILTLHKAGFNPHAMAQFFQMLQHFHLRYGHNSFSMFSSHPPTHKRIGNALSVASQFKPSTYNNNPEYLLLKARLLGINIDTWENFNEQLQYIIPSTIAGKQARLYATAVWYNQHHQLTKAAQTISILNTINHQQLLFQMLSIQINDHTQPHKALRAINKLEKNYPDYWPVTKLYAHILSHNNKPTQVVDMLLKKQYAYKYNLDYWNTLGKYAHQSKQRDVILQARASLALLSNNCKQAIWFYKSFIALPKIDIHKKVIIKHKLTRLQKKCLK